MSWTSKWRWPEDPPGRLPDGGEGVDQKVVERLALLDPLAEVHRPVGELLVGQRLHGGLELVDQGDELGQPADLLSLTGAQSPREDAHGGQESTAGPWRASVPAPWRPRDPGASPVSASGGGPRVAGVGPAHQLALQALDLVLELVHHQVDGDGRVGGGGTWPGRCGRDPSSSPHRPGG